MCKKGASPVSAITPVFSLNMLDLGWLLVLHASECMCKHGASPVATVTPVCIGSEAPNLQPLSSLDLTLKETITFAWGEGIRDGCATNIVILEEETR
jgi:hypothetical protein